LTGSLAMVMFLMDTIGRDENLNASE
jgi:hypothetical protein